MQDITPSIVPNDIDKHVTEISKSDILTVAGTILGGIVGFLLPYYVGIRKQKPIDERIKELTSYELRGYRDLMPHNDDALVQPDSYSISVPNAVEMLKKFKSNEYRITTYAIRITECYLFVEFK